MHLDGWTRRDARRGACVRTAAPTLRMVSVRTAGCAEKGRVLQRGGGAAGGDTIPAVLARTRDGSGVLPEGRVEAHFCQRVRVRMCLRMPEG